MTATLTDPSVLDSVAFLSDCDTDALDALAAAPMSVGNANRLATNIGSSVTLVQFIREILVNSFHALYGMPGVAAKSKSGPGKLIHLERVVVKGVAKFSVVDTGCGMSAGVLIPCIKDMASSAIDDGDRFGIGVTVAGLAHSPHGLEFITWDGTNQPVRARFGYRADGTPGAMPLANGNSYEFVDVTALPEAILVNGHGTQVIVHGEDASDDTFHRLMRAAGPGNKALCRYLNTKFWSWPSDVQVFADAYRKAADRSNVETRKVDVLGLARTAKALSKGRRSGTYEGGGFTFHWFVTDKANSSTLKHGDNAVTHGSFSVAIRSKEAEGLVEIYESFEGPKAGPRIGQYGLTPLASELILVLEIDTSSPAMADVKPNVQRTHLEQGGEELNYEYFANVVKGNMPDDLQAALDEALDRTKVDLNAAMSGLFARLDAALAGPKTGGLGRLVGLDGHNGRTGGTRASTGKGSAKDRSRTASDSPRSGDAADPYSKGTGTGGGKVIRWENIEGDDVYCFAQWEESDRTLKVNYDFDLLDAEVDAHLAGRSCAQNAKSRDRATDIVRGFWTEDVVASIVAATERRETARAAGADTMNWDFALQPQSLTAAAMPDGRRHQAVAASLTGAIGK